MILLALLLAQAATDKVRICDKANATLCASVASDGTLKVTTAAGGSFADNAAFTAGTTSVSNIGGVFNDSITDLTSGSAGAPRLTSKRAIHFNLRTNAGVEVPFPAALDADLGFKVHVQNTVTVTGTVTTTPPSNASTNVAQLAGTTTDTNSGLKSAGTLRVVLATDQPALTNKLLVTPDSVALPANQSVNVAQFGGTNTVTGTGAGGAGIPRVTISNDSSLAANQSVNLAQVGGTNTLSGGTAGSLGVGGLAADGSAVSGNPVLMAGKGFNGVALAVRHNCDKRAAFTTLGTTATVQQIALVAGQTVYVCGWYAIISTATTAVNIKWVTGTGTNCATGITDVTPFIFTTPTAAPAISNWNQAPVTGPPVAFSASASALCITQSSATNSTTLSGVIFYTQN